LRKIKHLLTMVILLASTQAFANGFGLGLIIGGPTGITAKYNLSTKNSVDAAISWAVGDRDFFYLHSTYLWNKANIFKINGENFDLYYGVGGRLISKESNDDPVDTDDDAFQVAVRTAIGLKYKFKDPSIELFAELSANLKVVPSSNFDVDLALGARFFF